MTNIFDDINKFLRTLFPSKRPTPAQFRRGKLPTGELVYKPDPNSRHVGKVRDKIPPMKRRFHGVSRTAKK